MAVDKDRTARSCSRLAGCREEISLPQGAEEDGGVGAAGQGEGDFAGEGCPPTALVGPGLRKLKVAGEDKERAIAGSESHPLEFELVETDGLVPKHGANGVGGRTGEFCVGGEERDAQGGQVVGHGRLREEPVAVTFADGNEPGGWKVLPQELRGGEVPEERLVGLGAHLLEDVGESRESPGEIPLMLAEVMDGAGQGLWWQFSGEAGPSPPLLPDDLLEALFARRVVAVRRGDGEAQSLLKLAPDEVAGGEAASAGGAEALGTEVISCEQRGSARKHESLCGIVERGGAIGGEATDADGEAVEVDGLGINGNITPAEAFGLPAVAPELGAGLGAKLDGEVLGGFGVLVLEASGADGGGADIEGGGDTADDFGGAQAGFGYTVKGERSGVGAEGLSPSWGEELFDAEIGMGRKHRLQATGYRLRRQMARRIRALQIHVGVASVRALGPRTDPGSGFGSVARTPHAVKRGKELSDLAYVMSPPDNRPPAAAAQHPDPPKASPFWAAQATPAATTGAVAHELANLLDGSLRNVGLVLSSLRQETERPTSPAALVDRLQAAREAMNQMIGLLRQWMDSSQPGTEIEQDERTVAEAVNDAVRLLAPAAEARSIRVSVQIAERASRMAAGPVYGVLANALRNSIEAIDSVPMGSAERGGLIEIQVRFDGESIEMRVSDDGPGLSPAVLAPDGRVAPGRTTKASGHGLGLQLCQDIAQSLAGSLDLHNRPGRGAELVLRYPWRKAS